MTTRTLVVVLVVLLGVVVLSPVVWLTIGGGSSGLWMPGPGMMMGGGGGGVGGWGASGGDVATGFPMAFAWIGGWLMFVAFFRAVAVASMIFVRSLTRGSAPETDSAMELLKRRLAAGEIPREQFGAIVQTLAGGAPR